MDKKIVTSPHLTIYKWEIQMICSILHRITGVGLFMAMIFFSCLFMAKYYGIFYYPMTGVWEFLANLVLIKCVIAVNYHLANGIRFLLLDFYPNLISRGSSSIVLGCYLTLTLFFILSATSLALIYL